MPGAAWRRRPAGRAGRPDGPRSGLSGSGAGAGAYLQATPVAPHPADRDRTRPAPPRPLRRARRAPGRSARMPGWCPQPSKPRANRREPEYQAVGAPEGRGEPDGRRAHRPHDGRRPGDQRPGEPRMLPPGRCSRPARRQRLTLAGVLAGWGTQGRPARLCPGGGVIHGFDTGKGSPVATGSASTTSLSHAERSADASPARDVAAPVRKRVRRGTGRGKDASSPAYCHRHRVRRR
jgi:hypothetical protein